MIGRIEETSASFEARSALAAPPMSANGSRVGSRRKSEPRIDSSCCFSTAQESDSRSNVSLATQFFQQPARTDYRKREQRKRDRWSLRNACPTWCPSTFCRRRCAIHQPARAARRVGGTLCNSNSPWISRVCCGRWFDELRNHSYRCVPRGGGLCRQDSQRCEAS